MDQNTRVFQTGYQEAMPEEEDVENGLYASAGYEEDEEGYEEDYAGYELEEGYLPQEEEYSMFHEELDDQHRFHVAMNVFDTASVLAGVVVILALTALIFSLFSWVKTDITHSFVILQSNIQ